MTVNASVQIEFRGSWIAACVVRTNAEGIGLEWQEFAPAAIVATIERLEELRQLCPSRYVAGPALLSNKINSDGA